MAQDFHRKVGVGRNVTACVVVCCVFRTVVNDYYFFPDAVRQDHIANLGNDLAYIAGFVICRYDYGQFFVVQIYIFVHRGVAVSVSRLQI